jgi:hypothetical protein
MAVGCLAGGARGFTSQSCWWDWTNVVSICVWVPFRFFTLAFAAWLYGDCKLVSDVEQVNDRPNYVVFEFSAIAWIIVHRSG